MLCNITRHFDAAHLNAIVNHPDVYPWVAGAAEGQLDLAGVVADPRNYVLLGEYGGVVFCHLQPGLYEAHTQIVPEGRGKWALNAAQACLHWMFTRTGAMEIMTRCPEGNVAATAMVRAIRAIYGGTHEFTNPKGWMRDGRIIPADIYALRIQDWVRQAPGLVERGQRFRDKLNTAVAKRGLLPEFESDGVHDRYIGMACEMLANGQPGKAAVLYNRFAAMTSAYPIEVVSADPVAVLVCGVPIIVRGDSVTVGEYPNLALSA